MCFFRIVLVAISLSLSSVSFSSIEVFNDVYKGVAPIGSLPSSFVRYYDRLNDKHYTFFVAYTKSTGFEVWVTDGSVLGTRLYYSVVESSVPERNNLELKIAGENLYVKSNYLSDDYSLVGVINLNSGSKEVLKVQGQGNGVWDIGNLHEAGGRIFFSTTYSFVNILDDTLWGSDGSLLGGVKDFSQRQSFRFYDHLKPFELNDELYFSAYSGGNGIYKTSKDEIVKIADDYTGQMVARGDDYILLGRRLSNYSVSWDYRLLDPVTNELSQFFPGKDVYFTPVLTTAPSDWMEKSRIGNLSFFMASGSGEGEELWVTRGTPESTYALPLTPGLKGTRIKIMGRVGDWMYFNVNGSTDNTLELTKGIWRTKETSESMELVLGVDNASMTVEPFLLQEISRHEAIFCFQESSGESNTLWRIDSFSNVIEEFSEEDGTRCSGPTIIMPEQEVALVAERGLGVGVELTFMSLDGALLGQKDIEPGAENIADNISYRHSGDQLLYQTKIERSTYDVWLTSSTPNTPSTRLMTHYSSKLPYINVFDRDNENYFLILSSRSETRAFVTSDGSLVVEYEMDRLPKYTAKVVDGYVVYRGYGSYQPNTDRGHEFFAMDVYGEKHSIYSVAVDAIDNVKFLGKNGRRFYFKEEIDGRCTVFYRVIGSLESIEIGNVGVCEGDAVDGVPEIIFNGGDQFWRVEGDTVVRLNESDFLGLSSNIRHENKYYYATGKGLSSEIHEYDSSQKVDRTLMSGYTIVENFVLLGDRILFSGFDSHSVSGIWSLNPETQSVNLVKAFDFATGNSFGVWPRLKLYIVDGMAYFLGFTEKYGYEWWVTSGTPDSTHLYADLYPGSADFDYFQAFQGSNSIYFNHTVPRPWPVQGSVSNYGGTYSDLYRLGGAIQPRVISPARVHCLVGKDCVVDLNDWYSLNGFDSVSSEVLHFPEWMDVSNSIVLGTPTLEGEHYIEYAIHNGKYRQTSEVRIDVVRNSVPYLAHELVWVFEPGQKILIDFRSYIRDADNNSLTYKVIGLPAQLELSRSQVNGVLDVGRYEFEVSAHDGYETAVFNAVIDVKADDQVSSNDSGGSGGGGNVDWLFLLVCSFLSIRFRLAGCLGRA